MPLGARMSLAPPLRRTRFIKSSCAAMLAISTRDTGISRQFSNRATSRAVPPLGAMMRWTRRLAQMNLAGGAIRNVALNAAFFAAADGQVVRPAHVLAAARREYAKLEKPLTEGELRGWARPAP